MSYDMSLRTNRQETLIFIKEEKDVSHEPQSLSLYKSGSLVLAHMP